MKGISIKINLLAIVVGALLMREAYVCGFSAGIIAAETMRNDENSGNNKSE